MILYHRGNGTRKLQLEMASTMVKKRSSESPPASSSLSDDDIELFQSLVTDVKPLQQDQIPPPEPKIKRREVFARKQEKTKQRDHATDPFSDEFQPHLPSGTMQWVAPGDEPFLAKRLRRRDYEPELILDLHGYTKAKAKLELAAAITACLTENIACLCVVHGIGHGVLRQQVPAWLTQHPAVRAFHQAPLEWGGQGALLVLLRMTDN